MSSDQKKQPLLKDIAGLRKHLDRARTAITGLGNAFKRVEEPRKSRHAGSKNHNKKRNKVRARMAAKSNQINRIRVKGWKH
jgi:uncharacterized protein YoxC